MRKYEECVLKTKERESKRYQKVYRTCTKRTEENIRRKKERAKTTHKPSAVPTQQSLTAIQVINI